MPTYDYECLDCGHAFEHFQSMTAKRLTKCPEDECKGKVQRKIGTGAGVIFKGSGFYETDYRSDAYKKSAAKDKESSKSESTSSKKSEGKKEKKKSASKSKASSTKSKASSGGNS